MTAILYIRENNCEFLNKFVQILIKKTLVKSEKLVYN